jgi:hypothetical protein
MHDFSEWKKVNRKEKREGKEGKRKGMVAVDVQTPLVPGVDTTRY